MRVGFHWLAVTAVLLSLGACWASFPDERMEPDGASSADVGQQDVKMPGPDQAGGDTGIQDRGSQGDVRPHDLFLVPDAFTCTPGAFIQCVGTDKLQRCNKKGDGVEVESCTPHECNPTAGRCNECDPKAPPTCAGGEAVSCTPAGLEQKTPCPLGCKDGACCNDVDNDKHTDCDGDCNDNDPQVFPGQTAWHTKPTSTGGFDYNCDNTEERQYPGPEACHFDKGVCVGEGWQGPVPACGNMGMLTTCKKQGNKCFVGTTKPATQGCR